MEHKPLFRSLVVFFEYKCVFLIWWNAHASLDINGLKKLILISADRLNKENVGDLIKICDYLFEVDISLIEKSIWVVSIDSIEH